MNVQEISRNDENPPLWTFLELAVALLGLTVGIWIVWSLYTKHKKRSGMRQNQDGLMAAM